MVEWSSLDGGTVMGRFKRSLHACVVSGFRVHVRLRCTSLDMGSQRGLGGEEDMGRRDAPLGCRKRVASGKVCTQYSKSLDLLLKRTLDSYATVSVTLYTPLMNRQTHHYSYH